MVLILRTQKSSELINDVFGCLIVEIIDLPMTGNYIEMIGFIYLHFIYS